MEEAGPTAIRSVLEEALFGFRSNQHRSYRCRPGLDMTSGLATALGAALLRVASKSLQSGVSESLGCLYESCCATLATVRRRVGVGPEPCVYWGLGAVCSLAMAPGAPLLHVASKSLRSGVSLGWNLGSACMGAVVRLWLSCVDASVSARRRVCIGACVWSVV